MISTSEKIAILKWLGLSVAAHPHIINPPGALKDTVEYYHKYVENGDEKDLSEFTPDTDPEQLAQILGHLEPKSFSGYIDAVDFFVTKDSHHPHLSLVNHTEQCFKYALDAVRQETKYKGEKNVEK